MWRRSLLNKIVTLYMFSFLSFFTYVSCFLCKIYGICPLFCYGCVVTKTHVRFKCVLHNFHESCMLNICASCIVLESLCCHQVYSSPVPTCVIEKQKRHNDCGCLKILTFIVTVLLSVMRMHPRYEFCGSLHVTYLVLVRTLLIWSKYVPDSDACFHKYIPWFMPHFHLLSSWIKF